MKTKISCFSKLRKLAFGYIAASSAAALVTCAAASDAPAYKLGYLVDASGPQQTTMLPAYNAFRAYVDLINQHGGINGRKIEILGRDTQSDVQRSLDAVQEFGRDGALGILGLPATNTHAAVFAAAKKLDIPVLAGYPINTPVVLPPAKPGAFGVGLELSLAGTVGGYLAKEVAPHGKSTICVAFEVPGSILSCQKIVATAKAHGFSGGEVLTVPIQQRDFRTVVERIVSEKPDVVTICLGQAHVAAFLPALATSGYDGIFLSMDTGIGEDTLLKATPADSKLTVYSYARYVKLQEVSKPEFAAFRAELEKRGQSKETGTGGLVLGLVITDALRKCGNGCTGPSDFASALEKVDVDTNGLTGAPIRLTLQDHYGESAYRLTKLDNSTHQFTPVGGWLKVETDGKISN
ncbi:ABC transporter substrate-binding protein [Hyphomicrobium sp. MC1]|uniref:ABC transporter substrate-binding protein n=1 Tax=Hyphomicrobium sp. (strain MC1) TaxID=717785 RepID=UPI0018D49796|nr:ABC transporter substrate-binding protein [Hyphomicrobium sp. MC1]